VRKISVLVYPGFKLLVGVSNFLVALQNLDAIRDVHIDVVHARPPQVLKGVPLRGDQPGVEGVVIVSARSVLWEKLKSGEHRLDIVANVLIFRGGLDPNSICELIVNNVYLRAAEEATVRIRKEQDFVTTEHNRLPSIRRHIIALAALIDKLGQGHICRQCFKSDG
jgi:hypothetical protein